MSHEFKNGLMNTDIRVDFKTMRKNVKERGNKLYRLMDKYLGIPLVRLSGLFNNNHRTIPSDIKRIGILRTSCIGDAILLDAVSKDLRVAWPQARQIFFAGRDNYQVAEMMEEIDEVMILPMNQPWSAAKKVYEAGRFDLWLDFSQWARIDALLTRVARADCKIGFKTPMQYRHYGYDKWVEHRDNIHEMENYRNLVAAAGVKSEFLPAFRADPELFETSDDVKPGISYIVLHMFPGGSKAKMKEWPEEYWLEVTRFCLSKGWAVVLTGGQGDYTRAQNFRDKLGIDEEVFNLAGRLSLTQLPSLLAKGKLVVSVNTGVMHLAAAVGARLIAIHGPTSPRRWGPLSQHAKVIQPQNMTCSPCLHLGFEYKCDKNYCLQSVPAKVVIDAIRSASNLDAISAGWGLNSLAEITIERPSRRPRVLLLAAACNPYKGSDSAVGWGRAVETAKRFDTWVITRQEDQEDIGRYLDEHGEIFGLHFYFLEKIRIEEFLKRRRPLYDIHYLPYNSWQRRAFNLAAHLHRELKFDLVHQVTRTGFRETGYLWKLEAPFIWGPVGGTQNYPWRFLKAAGFRGALKEGLRSLINVVQFRFSPRVRKALKKAETVVAANVQIQKDFERVHGIKPNILLDIGVHVVKDGSAKKSLHNSFLRILWIGQLKHHKALHLLIQALAQKPAGFDYELKVLGDGPLKKRWQALAKQLGVDSHCQWPGWIPHELAMQEYDWADVLVFSSLRDTASNVVLEALSRGVPIICLDHQGAKDVVTDDCGIKIPVTTPGEFIAKLRNHLFELAADRTKLESLSRGALKRASQYLWSRNGERMARIYSTALQAHHADRAQAKSQCDVEKGIQDNG